MELSELTAYAEENFHIREERPWQDFPGFSVLRSPQSGKWVALLMRQWDSDLGEEMQRCDIKCGPLGALGTLFREKGIHSGSIHHEQGSDRMYVTADDSSAFLTRPFRMKGQKWVGVVMDTHADREVVCRLFSRAVRMEEEGEQVLANRSKGPGAGRHSPANEDTRLWNGSRRLDGMDGTVSPGGESWNYTVELESVHPAEQGKTVEQKEKSKPDRENLLRQAAARIHYYEQDIPEKILQMQRLYRYGANTFSQKSRNFYRQGKFMENYEDDAPWDGNFLRYFPTYHDLNVRQLRGYFTWRTHLRRGDFRPIATSLAYIYLYELLCGIGVDADSPREALAKMQAFEKGFLTSGIGGDEGMRKNLRRWMFDYCILHGLSAEDARSCADPETLQRDAFLAALREPQKCSDEELFAALCSFGGKKEFHSPVLKKEKNRGKHLYASVWRLAIKQYSEDGQDLFTVLFGKPRIYTWHPFANAIHREPSPGRNKTYVLNECRSYQYHAEADGWTEKRYEPLFFDREKIQSFLHGTDGALRRALRTGSYLKDREQDAWVKPYVAAVLAAEKAAEKKREREEKMAEITIDLSHLEHIRRDAEITRDSLLTEEDVSDGDEMTVGGRMPAGRKAPTGDKVPAGDEGTANVDMPAGDEGTANVDMPAGDEGTAEVEVPAGDEGTAKVEVPAGDEGTAEVEVPAGDESDAKVEVPAGDESDAKVEVPAGDEGTANVEGPASREVSATLSASSEMDAAPSAGGLDPTYIRILKKLLRGEPIDRVLEATHLLPSIAADRINEALFEEIGDTVLLCEDDRISLVEEYVEDVREILELQ